MEQIQYIATTAMFRIYYYKSFHQIEKIAMKHVAKIEKDKRYFEKHPCKTLEQCIYLFIDVIKEHVIRYFPNPKKIRFDIQYFQPKNSIHQFLLDFSKIHHPNIDKWCEDDIKKSVFVIIYDENNELHFVSVLSYNRLRKEDYDYYIYLKKLRKLNI